MAESIPEDLVNIDGNVLEGGGQILRNCATLSCLLNKPIRVTNIRAGRSNPGLRPQHLTGLQLIKEICNGKLQGGEVGSSEITFIPGKVKAGSYTGDTKTAGSICLLMQAALPCFIFADGEVNLRLLGGTNADMAPQIDYALMVFRPFASKFGMNFTGGILRRGFYPKGGGEVQLKVFPSKCLNAVDATNPGKLTRITGQAFVAGVLPIKVARAMSQSAQDVVRDVYPDVSMHIDVKQEPSGCAIGTGTGITGFYPKGGGEVQLKVFPSKCLNAVDATNPGKLTRITGQAFVAGVLPIKVARAMSQSAQDVVRDVYPDVSMHIDVKQEPSGCAIGTGTGITIVGETSTGCLLAGSALGKKGVPADKVGKDAGEMLLNNLDHGGCVDDFLQDQIIILMALAKGKSRVLCGPLSLHTQTAIHVAQIMTGVEFEVKELSKTSTLIECEGIGLKNQYQ